MSQPNLHNIKLTYAVQEAYHKRKG